MHSRRAPCSKVFFYLRETVCKTNSRPNRTIKILIVFSLCCLKSILHLSSFQPDSAAGAKLPLTRSATIEEEEKTLELEVLKEEEEENEEEEEGEEKTLEVVEAVVLLVVVNNFVLKGTLGIQY